MLRRIIFASRRGRCVAGAAGFCGTQVGDGARTWAGSNATDSVAWSYCPDLYAKETGQLKPKECGLDDMSGNMLEWCSDFYDPGYYARSSPKNPRGPETGLYRVLRGGFIRHTANEYRVFARHSEEEMSISDAFEMSLVGVRLVVGRE
jgi:formylglycine-generating enzyme required for sulfatase activity